MSSLACSSCGGPLPAAAVDIAVTCTFCGFVSSPAPKVIEKIVERVRPHIIVQDESGKTTELFCLRCAYKMRVGHFKDIELQLCEGCGGVFLTKDVVERLAQHPDSEFRQYILRMEMSAMGRPDRGPVDCPMCKARMEVASMPGTVHNVDLCRAHGTWFDRTELAAYIEAQAAAQEAEKPAVTDDDLQAAGVGGGFFKSLGRLFH